MVSQPIDFSTSIEIAAPPAVVWALVTEVTRMGEWSPECVRAEWHGGSTGPAAGARFVGHNQAGTFEWSVPSQVTDCVEGSVFAFVAPAEMEPADHRTTWRYEFAPSGAGCTLTESFHAPLLDVEGSASNFDGRYAMLCAAVEQTLANIKAAAERP